MSDAWIGVIGTLAGAVIGFALTELTRLIERKRRESRHWSALRAEVESCAAFARECLDSNVMAPLWRLPRAAYASAVSAGMFSTGEASALAAFYSSVDQLNRGLDAVAAAVQRGDDRANEEHGRNRIKAMRLVHNGEHYAMANGTLTSRAV